MGKVLDILNGVDTCPELNALKQEIGRFVCKVMKPYNERVQVYCNQHRLSSENTKNFYDAVWGTIAINEGEKLILDSPILQRLRNIKQLGLADFLYSSANHTRFSHTLGVLYTASFMWKQIEGELNKNRTFVEDDVAEIIRLAALFHDCGHMFCSHASERFFQNDISYSRQKDIQRARNFFGKKLRIKPSLTEIFSILIVCTPEVMELLTCVQKGLNEIRLLSRQDKDDLSEKICCLILGFPYSVETIPYAQIISGQIDSDKLDYLKRDSHTTGVPVAVDMSRIFQKLRVVKTCKHFTMVSNNVTGDTQVYRLGIAPAAINTVDHLVISRYMMFENIYFHQKVLTAEETLRYALKKIDQCTTGLLNDFSVVLELNDALVVSQQFEQIVGKIFADRVIINEQDELFQASRLLCDLSNRVLLKRCVSFTNENLTDIGQVSCNFYSDVFIGQKPREKEKFVSKVIEEVKYIKDLMAGELKYKEETDIILIVTPPISSISLNSNIAIADKINRDRNMDFEADNWLKSRTTRKPSNYLASYEEDRYIVFIATEKVLLKEYGLLLNDTILYDSDEEAQIVQLKRILDRKGYFNDAYALLPDDEIMRFSSELLRLVEKWQRYERLNIETSKRQPVDLATLTAYIKQFYRFRDELKDFDVFIRGCIELLNNVQVISKDIIKQTLEQNIQKVKELACCSYDDIQICSLGTLQDSSAQIAYQVNEVNAAITIKTNDSLKGESDLNFKVKLVDELEEKDIKPVMLFIEDAFSSGKQITSIFEEMMGVPIKERQTQESHCKELSNVLKEKLKKSSIYFSFIFYKQENEKKFKKRLGELGIKNVTLLQYKDFPTAYFKRNDIDDKEAFELTKKYFEQAGRILLEDKAKDKSGNYKPGWDMVRVESSLLGYWDEQQLIVFPWNTPTYTVTALWLSSIKEGWYSLFQRVDK